MAIPLAIAAVLAAILVPLADRLERWRVPRWLGATFVLIFALSARRGHASPSSSTGSPARAMRSGPSWRARSSRSTTDASRSPASSDQLIGVAHELVRVLTSGLLGSLFSSASSFVVGSVLAIFMLLFLLKDWDQITGWTAGHLGLPELRGSHHPRRHGRRLPRVRRRADPDRRGQRGGRRHRCRGAGVPLVGTIALVSFVTSYVPYLGAFVAGAFAVLIAYGSGGLGVAIAMLAIVLLANNTIQNLVEPFAFGTRLRLHPLAVLLTVTTATMLFGVMGAILAAPLTSAAVNAYHQLRGPVPPLRSASRKTLGLRTASTDSRSRPAGAGTAAPRRGSRSGSRCPGERRAQRPARTRPAPRPSSGAVDSRPVSRSSA